MKCVQRCVQKCDEVDDGWGELRVEVEEVSGQTAEVIGGAPPLGGLEPSHPPKGRVY